MKNGLEDYYVIRGNKKMRFGYTTGSCAAAACRGAAEILLSGKRRETVQLMTPKGILLTLELKDIQIEPDKVTCAIQKDAGDDPDTTNGILVYASVKSQVLSLTEVSAWEESPKRDFPRRSERQPSTLCPRR